MGNLIRFLGAMAISTLLLPLLAISAQRTQLQDVEITEAAREQLLTATIEAMVEPPSEAALRAIGIGKIDRIVLTQLKEKPTKGEVGFGTDEWTTRHTAWVYYERVQLSSSQEYQPMITCSSQGENIWFQDCREDSYIRLKAEWMDKPIRFDANLTDQEIKSLYSAVDDAELVSETDGEIVTSDKIYMVLKSNQAENRVNVWVTTAKKGYSNAIFFKGIPTEDGRTKFAVLDFYCPED